MFVVAGCSGPLPNAVPLPLARSSPPVSHHLLHLPEIQSGMENPHPQPIYTSCLTSPRARSRCTLFGYERYNPPHDMILAENCMGTGSLQAAFDRSLKDPAGFWGEAAEAVHWYKKWDKVLDDSRQPFYRWFVGGEVNTCYNALDLHIDEGRGDQPPLIYDSPVTSASKTFTYRELRDRVAGFAGALARLGVGKGDRVIIYMPMVPEAAVAMLACARLGAVHSVVFGGFAANELAARIDDANPKVIVSA